MKASNWLLAIALVGVACGGRSSGSLDANPYSKIVVKPENQTLQVGLGGSASQAYQVVGIVNGVEADITTDCLLGVDTNFGRLEGSKVTVGARGGQTEVTALCGGQAASPAVLTIKLAGTIIEPGAPNNAPALFGAAAVTVDPMREPVVEYPLHGAVAPINFASVEVQWAARGNDLFHVVMTSTFVTVDVYTTSVEAALSAANWDVVAGTAGGRTITFVVEGLTQAAAATKFVSSPITVDISRDAIDRTTIYYWASSQGSIMSSLFGSTAQPTQVRGDCTSCHSLSRTGTRFGYSRCVGNDCNEVYVGFMRFNKQTGVWDDTVDANNRALRGSYTTFSPVGNPFPTDDQALAMVTLRDGSLGLYDPDTGAAVPSNLTTAAAQGPGAPRSALMADWSADGATVVYASTPVGGQWIDLTNSAIARMSYSYATGAHVFGDPDFLVENPIVLPSGTYNNFFFPSLSPDGKLVAFNAARSGWRNFMNAKLPGQRLMLVDAQTNVVTDLSALNGGYVDSDITWPHWAPGGSSDYYWIVFSSQRDYGHKLTSATTAAPCVANGVQQCKQIWIAGISKAKLLAGGDPSAAPMWLPGQSIGANNISPFWTKPAGVE